VDFTFDEDQTLLQSTVRDFLAKECTPAHVRACWARDAAHDAAFWHKLAELGIPGLLVPEAHGGMGLDETTAVLLFEEFGRAALPEPVIATVAVAAPLLAEAGGALAEAWLPRLAAGSAVVATADAASPFVADADAADLLLLSDDAGALRAVLPAHAECVREPANDPSRRLFSVRSDPADGTPLGDAAAAARAFDRGSLAAAAEQLGVAQRLVEMAAAYAEQRHQFGRPIGAFQAVKHMLADVVVKLEYARPVVQRAAFSVATRAPEASLHVSMAKVAASDAAVCGRERRGRLRRAPRAPGARRDRLHLGAGSPPVDAARLVARAGLRQEPPPPPPRGGRGPGRRRAPRAGRDLRERARAARVLIEPEPSEERSPKPCPRPTSSTPPARPWASAAARSPRCTPRTSAPT
jgi:hypothetical protein